VQGCEDSISLEKHVCRAKETRNYAKVMATVVGHTGFYLLEITRIKDIG